MPERAGAVGRGAVAVRTEYDALERVAVCAPTHFAPTRPINARQADELDGGPPISAELLAAEHRGLVDALTAHGVEPIALEPEPTAPYMLNARDPAFVVGTRLFVSRMRVDVRAMEPASVVAQLGGGAVDDAAVSKAAVSEVAVPEAAMVRLTEGFVEGGDVVVDGDTVLCGVGERTDHAGAAALARLLPDGVALREVPLADDVLHLDTAVGLASGLAFVWRDGLAEPDAVVRFLETRGEVVEVDDDEARGFATNFLMLSPTAALIPAGVPRIAALFAARGIEAEEVPFDEHHRSGGSIRCATMPLRRRGPTPAET